MVTSVLAEAHAELNNKIITDSVNVFHNITVEHKDVFVYTLTAKTEEEYSSMVDSYTDFLRKKYDSDSVRCLVNISNLV